jgi:hypothetical protein
MTPASARARHLSRGQRQVEAFRVIRDELLATEAIAA